jgi:hypothetical protein
VSPSDTEKFSDLILHKQVIPIDDATVITSMASVLGKRDIPFRIAGAEQTSLTDLRMQPVILIGAADNKWTVRLTQALRYRLEVVRPSGQKEPIASIVDAQQPAGDFKRFRYENQQRNRGEGRPFYQSLRVSARWSPTRTSHPFWGNFRIAGDTDVHRMTV